MRFDRGQLLQLGRDVQPAIGQRLSGRHRGCRGRNSGSSISGVDYSSSDADRRIRKAVFPAAGLGTRFLPATKAQPKEMLPAGRQADHPVRRRGSCGFRACPTSSWSPAAARTPSRTTSTWSTELESFLESRGKHEQLADEIRKISDMINVCYVRQGEPLGLGHAVLVTETLVGDEPFAVILGDDVIDADAAGAATDDRRCSNAPTVPCWPSSACRWTRSRTTASSPASRRPNSGQRVYRVKDLVEKPPRDQSAVRPGDHRPLHPDAGHLPCPARDRQGQVG